MMLTCPLCGANAAGEMELLNHFVRCDKVPEYLASQQAENRAYEIFQKRLGVAQERFYIPHRPPRDKEPSE